MTVTFAGEIYNCTRAIRTADRATLYLDDGGTVEFVGINDFSAFSIEGGEWETPEPTETEQLRADVDFVMIMEGLL